MGASLERWQTWPKSLPSFPVWLIYPPRLAIGRVTCFGQWDTKNVMQPQVWEVFVQCGFALSCASPVNALWRTPGCPAEDKEPRGPVTNSTPANSHQPARHKGSSSTSSSWQQELAMREASEINTSSLAQNLPTDPQSWELNICWVLAADFYRS